MSLRIFIKTLRTLGRGLVSGLPEPSDDRDPIELFQEWFAVARESNTVLPNAMALATSTPGGKPSTRMVLLKGVDESGFTFYTNYESRKASELETNPFVAAVIHWEVLQRQVRIEGTVTRITQDESDAYFKSRPRGSQIGAWASKQSRPLTERSDLERSVERTKAEFDGSDVPLPPFWGGYRIAPTEIEFWQGRANRLHDRVRFTRDGDRWRTERLYP